MDETFGCYIYGHDPALINGYVAIAGFILSPLSDPKANQTVMKAGDLLDNDADAFVDEEQANGIDDDGDGRIDEDLGMPKSIHGGWSEWTDISCVGECGYGVLAKTRKCDNPAPQGKGRQCVGQATSGDMERCWTGHTCPQDCPYGSYLMDCVGDCSNCEHDCDKFNGSCDRCKLGWMDPLHACTTGKLEL
ncbi:thrombospondin-1-like [Physella acuta]|uniref:thrombospondin-1-like n=1 Tax=Physella acuta TaxID=109671 RepID=UPI0027DD7096|nr:thrombospondin-1-like [Physella acuta]